MRQRSCQDEVIRGNSFVPSYFRPLRNIPYMAWSNFLATAMCASRRALFSSQEAFEKGFCVEITTGCDQRRHTNRSSQSGDFPHGSCETPSSLELPDMAASCK